MIMSYFTTRGELVKVESQNIYTSEGFRVYAQLSVYEDFSEIIVNVFNGEGPAICTLLSGFSNFRNHEEVCRQKLNQYLNSEDFKNDCETLSAEYEAV